jgi:hypothetical protein
LRRGRPCLFRHLWLFGGRAAVEGRELLSFPSTPHLDPSDYGINELLTNAIAVLGYLAGINMTNAMARHYFDSAEPRHRRLVVSTTLWTVLGASLLLGGSLALGAGPIAGWLADRSGSHPDLQTVVLLTPGIGAAAAGKSAGATCRPRTAARPSLSRPWRRPSWPSPQIWLVGYEGRGRWPVRGGLPGRLLTVLALASCCCRAWASASTPRSSASSPRTRCRSCPTACCSSS